MTLDEAKCAIYLAAAPPPSGRSTPAILSALRRGLLTHWIVDPSLPGAPSGMAVSPAIPLAAVARLLSAESRATDSWLCGWGSLDDVGNTPGGTSARVVRATHRYRDVSEFVARWAATYPAARLRGRRRGGKGLHTGFRLSGYRPDWRNDRVGPAARVRRLREQMMSGGRPAGRDAQARRDWQRLLADSTHDCLGLHALVLRAAAEMEKRAAYLEAVYTVFDGRRAIDFTVGSPNPRLDAVVVNRQARGWAHISACDPGLQSLSPAENQTRSERLRAVASQRGFAVLRGAGQDRERRRPAEETVFIIGIGAAEARVLGRQFGQWAIVTGTVPGAARLIWCLDPGADPLVVNQLVSLG